jgi:hypothetical protein
MARSTAPPATTPKAVVESPRMVPSSAVSLAVEADRLAADEEVLLRAAVVPPVAVAPNSAELNCSAWLETVLDTAVE